MAYQYKLKLERQIESECFKFKCLLVGIGERVMFNRSNFLIFHEQKKISKSRLNIINSVIPVNRRVAACRQKEVAFRWTNTKGMMGNFQVHPVFIRRRTWTWVSCMVYTITAAVNSKESLSYPWKISQKWKTYLGWVSEWKKKQKPRAHFRWAWENVDESLSLSLFFF